MSEAASPRGERHWRPLLGVVLSLLLCGLLAWKLELGSVAGALAMADVPFLVLALVVALVANTFGSAETLYHVLCAVGAPLGRLQTLSATLMNMALQAALPLGGGHASRALLLTRACSVDPSRAALSVPVLLGTKLVALAVLSAAGLVVQQPIALLIGVVAIAAGIWLALRAGVRGRLALVGAFAAAVVLTLLQIVVFVLLLSALGVSLPFSIALARLPLCLLLAKIPFTWMGFGTREASVVFVFAGAADPGVLALGSLFFGVMDQIAPGLLGIFFAPRFVARVLD